MSSGGWCSIFLGGAGNKPADPPCAKGQSISQSVKPPIAQLVKPPCARSIIRPSAHQPHTYLIQATGSIRGFPPGLLLGASPLLSANMVTSSLRPIGS